MAQLVQHLLLVLGLVIGLLALLAGGGLAFAYYRVWREPQDYDTVSPVFGRLLRSGLNGGFIIITHARSKTWIQLSKYIRARGDYGIELSVPEVDWTRPYFAQIEALIDRHRLVSRIVAGSDGTRFLDVDFGKDAQKAAETGRAIFRDVFRAPLSGRFHYETSGIAALDQLIDDPGQEPLSAAEAYKRFREERGASGDVHHCPACRPLLALFLALAGGTGAVISAGSITGSWLALTIELGGVQVRAPVFDVICLGAYFLGRAIWRADRKEPATKPNEGLLARVSVLALRLLVFASIGIVIARWFSW